MSVISKYDADDIFNSAAMDFVDDRAFDSEGEYEKDDDFYDEMLAMHGEPAFDEPRTFIDDRAIETEGEDEDDGYDEEDESMEAIEARGDRERYPMADILAKHDKRLAVAEPYRLFDDDDDEEECGFRYEVRVKEKAQAKGTPKEEGRKLTGKKVKALATMKYGVQCTEQGIPYRLARPRWPNPPPPREEEWKKSDEESDSGTTAPARGDEDMQNDTSIPPSASDFQQFTVPPVPPPRNQTPLFLPGSRPDTPFETLWRTPVPDSDRWGSGWGRPTTPHVSRCFLIRVLSLIFK